MIINLLPRLSDLEKWLTALCSKTYFKTYLRNKKIPFQLYLIAFLLLAPFSSALAAEKGAISKSLTACYHVEAWPPYVNGQGLSVPDDPGLLISQFKQAVAAQGIQLTLLRRPWKRCMNMLSFGSIDAVLHASYTKTRSQYAVYPMTKAGQPDPKKSILFADYYIFIHPDNLSLYFDGKKIHGLEGELGIDLGYSVRDALLSDQLPFTEYQNIEDGLRLLQTRRLDGYITFTDRMKKRAEKLGLSFKRLQPPYLEKAYFHIFSPKWYAQYPDDVEAIWQATSQENNPNRPRY